MPLSGHLTQKLRCPKSNSQLLETIPPCPLLELLESSVLPFFQVLLMGISLSSFLSHEQILSTLPFICLNSHHFYNDLTSPRCQGPWGWIFPISPSPPTVLLLWLSHPGLSSQLPMFPGKTQAMTSSTQNLLALPTWVKFKVLTVAFKTLQNPTPAASLSACPSLSRGDTPGSAWAAPASRAVSDMPTALGNGCYLCQERSSRRNGQKSPLCWSLCSLLCHHRTDEAVLSRLQGPFPSCHLEARSPVGCR